MYSLDSNIKRYLPTIGRNVVENTFKNTGLECTPSNLNIVEVNQKNGDAGASNKVWQAQATDVGVTLIKPFTTKGSRQNQMETRFDRLQSQYLELILTVGLTINGPECRAVLLIKTYHNMTNKINARKMKRFSALVEFRNYGGAKQIKLNFTPGICSHAKDHDGNQKVFEIRQCVWFTILKLEQLSPLPWEKYDKNWVNGFHGRLEGIIEFKRIHNQRPLTPTPTMAMLDDQAFTDMVIKCWDGVDVKCHRFVLAVASEPLKMLLVRKEEEKKTVQCLEFGELFRADSKTTMAFLRCLYSDCEDVEGLEASLSGTYTVLRIAHQYLIPSIVETCVQIIMAEQDPDWFDNPKLYKLYQFVNLWKDERDGFTRMLKVELEKKLRGHLTELQKKGKQYIDEEDDEEENGGLEEETDESNIGLEEEEIEDERILQLDVGEERDDEDVNEGIPAENAAERRCVIM